MLASVKDRLFRRSVRVLRSIVGLAGKDALRFASEELSTASGLGLGRYPIGFRPEEIEVYRDDAAASIEAVRAYDASAKATGCEVFDNFAKRGRFYLLHQLMELAYDTVGQTGAIAECGCWRGQSTYMLADIARRRGATTFHVFDSFEGLSAYGDQDRGALAPDNERDAEARRKIFAASEADVRRALSGFPFVKFYRGWIPDRFAEVENETFKFVHIDVDLYQPYKDSIEFFFPRLLPGGMLVFDDYGSSGFPGARRAVDELHPEFKPRMFLRFPLAGAVWIK